MLSHREWRDPRLISPNEFFIFFLSRVLNRTNRKPQTNNKKIEKFSKNIYSFHADNECSCSRRLCILLRICFLLPLITTAANESNAFAHRKNSEKQQQIEYAESTEWKKSPSSLEKNSSRSRYERNISVSRFWFFFQLSVAATARSFSCPLPSSRACFSRLNGLRYVFLVV